MKKFWKKRNMNQRKENIEELSVKDNRLDDRGHVETQTIAEEYYEG